MFSKETETSRKKGIQFLLALVLLVAAFCVMPASPAQAKSDPQVTNLAKKHKISKGKWVKKAKGMKYKKKNGSFVKSQWCTIDGKICYFNEKGYMQTGSFQYKGCYYYADAKGNLYRNKLLKKKGKVYYYGSTGARVQGRWRKIGGKTYYFCRTGEMVTNSWVGNSYVGKDGAKVSNKTVQGRKLNKNGEIQKLAKNDDYIFVGASRVVDMSIAVKGTGTVFLAKSGQGLSWLKNTASVQLKTYLKKNPKCTVVFMLGHNDLKKVNSYIKYYKSLIKKYPKASFYFVNVLPKTKEETKAKKSRLIFNQKMEAAFGNRCIDAEAYLRSRGCLYDTIDGTHYPQNVSRVLYRYVMDYIKSQDSGKKGSGSGTVSGGQGTYDLKNQTGSE